MAPRRIVDQLNDGTDPEDDDRELEAADDTSDDADPEDDDDQDDDTGDDDDDQTEDNPPIGDEDEQPPARSSGRRENDVARLRRERREERQRREELEEEVARLRGGGGGGGRQQDSEAVRNARLAAMEPQERTEYLINEERAERQRERQIDRFEAADRSDRELYNERARNNPRYKKYQGEVERRLRLLRAQGQNAPRESVLRYIVGERVLEGSSSPRTKKDRKDAERRVERERTTLPRGKGENRGRGGSKSADLEKRLANVSI